MFVSVKNHSQNTFSLFFVFFFKSNNTVFYIWICQENPLKKQILEALARLLPLLIKGAITQFNKAS